MAATMRSCLPQFLLLASALAMGGPARGEILHQSQHGFVLENRIETSASPQTSWEALTAEVGQWWPAAHSWFGQAGNFSINPVAGGCFCEVQGDQQVEHMRIVHANPGVLLRMLGGLGPLQGMGLSGPLDWHFEALDKGGTRISLRYHVSGYSPKPLGDFIAIVDQVQAQQLGALGAFLARQQNP